MADVFISYKKERRAYAKRLAAVIEAYGFDVWWDYSLLVDAGDYDAQIEQSLLSAKATIVLWCSGARASSFVKDEARRARDAKKLLTVLIEGGVEPPLGFGMSEMAILVGWTGDPTAPGVIKLIDGIERVAGRKRVMRPNMIDMLRESAPLPAVEAMIVTDGTDTNAPPHARKGGGGHSEGSGAAATLLNDLRATWAGLDRRNAAVVGRFKDRVAQVAPGSGLEFEVENALSELAARAAAKQTEPEARDERASAPPPRREQTTQAATPNPLQAGRAWFGPGVAELMGRPVPVHFTEGSRAIQNAINVEFNQLWRILRKNAALRVTIASNTADGSLGKARADAVASYLRVIGIDRARISFAHTGADAVTVTMQ